MAVDYGAGRENLGRLYADLRQALANKGIAENLQAQQDIDNKGLFGTGIRTSDIDKLGNLAIKGAEFGQGRKALKMERAKDSFDRRMEQARNRITELRRFGDRNSINEIRAIQAGMAEERNKFENIMSDYEEKSLWDTGFGNKGPNYKDTGEMSAFSKAMMASGKPTKRKEYPSYSPSLEDGYEQEGRGEAKPTYYPSMQDEMVAGERKSTFPERPPLEGFLPPAPKDWYPNKEGTEPNQEEGYINSLKKYLGIGG